MIRKKYIQKAEMEEDQGDLQEVTLYEVCGEQEFDQSPATLHIEIPAREDRSPYPFLPLRFLYEQVAA